MLWFLPYSGGNSTRNTPLVTMAIIIANVLVFLFTWHGGDFGKVVEQFGFVPSEPRLLTLFTYQFLHAGYLHIFFNMWILWIFGTRLEDLVGPVWYFPYYVLCGVSAAVLHALVAGSGAGASVPTIGASGAVFGVMGGYFVLFSRSYIRGIIMFLVFPLPVPLAVPAVFFLALTIVTASRARGLPGRRWRTGRTWADSSSAPGFYTSS